MQLALEMGVPLLCRPNHILSFFQSSLKFSHGLDVLLEILRSLLLNLFNILKKLVLFLQTFLNIFAVEWFLSFGELLYL
jgi:hypothetical protein